jgi:hypothetical protein
MEQFQQRVFDEKDALDEKLAKLAEFVGLDLYNKLPADEQYRLTSQLKFMREYSRVLAERITAFKQ